MFTTIAQLHVRFNKVKIMFKVYYIRYQIKHIFQLLNTLNRTWGAHKIFFFCLLKMKKEAKSFKRMHFHNRNVL